MAQESDEGFRVTDRRRRDTTDDPAPRNVAPPPPQTTIEEPFGAPDGRNLTGLFLMLATEAMIALGDTPDPATGAQQRELPQAAGVIDVLALLRDKTEGNRSAEETRMLDELLYDLRLRYVRAAKSAG